MKVTVIKIPAGVLRATRYRAQVSQGCQSFRIGYEGTKVEAKWWAKMFRKALKNHDRAKGKKAFDAQSVGK